MKITITIPCIFCHIRPFCLIYFANTLWYRASWLHAPQNYLGGEILCQQRRMNGRMNLWSCVTEAERPNLLGLSLPSSFSPQTTGAGMMRFLHVLRKHFRKKERVLKKVRRRTQNEKKKSNMSEWSSWHRNKMTNEAFRIILFLKRYPELNDRFTRRDRCINLNWICFTAQMVADIITWFMLPFETSFSCNVTLSLLSFMFAGWRCEPCLFCFEQELMWAKVRSAVKGSSCRKGRRYRKKWDPLTRTHTRAYVYQIPILWLVNRLLWCLIQVRMVRLGVTIVRYMKDNVHCVIFT